ncbi:MAG: coenzyme F420-0:L-glutamate ligase [Candidatus Bathyarchaeia archaeon]
MKSPIIKLKDDLVNILCRAMCEHKLELENEDIVAISSKVLATAQGRIVKLDHFLPSQRAKKLGKSHSLEPEFVEVILQEAEEIYGGVERAILTLKEGVLTVNAGIDHKNAPANSVALWPLNPQKFAEIIRNRIEQKTGKNIGIIIVDSEVAPLRMGTRGLALAVAGFKPVKDCRNERDLYQKPILITRHAIADDLASSAHLLMGETGERTPFVLIKDAPVAFTDEEISFDETRIPANKCVYAAVFKMSTINSKTMNP